ncbi:MAG: hypothetical protein L7F78_18325 [Syntrophales bacterium LBB04]|nr:hypothetical protein [Syntrophales bacterium LBB04]
MESKRGSKANEPENLFGFFMKGTPFKVHPLHPKDYPDKTKKGNAQDFCPNLKTGIDLVGWKRFSKSLPASLCQREEKDFLL